MGERLMSEKPFLKIDGLTKKYGDTTILSNIDLSINKGDTLMICGPSGCGKSTLLRCLNGLEQVEAGSLTIGERHVDLSDPKQRESARQGTGLVFQNFNLFPHMSVLDNITLAPRRVMKTPKSTAEDDAKDLLDLIGLTDRMHAYPCELSGGQRQRVAIARALAMNPELLMFDEPTSALDPEKKEEVLGVIRELKSIKNVTMIVVTHEIGFGKTVSDWAMLLEAGKVVELEPSKDFFNAPKSQRTKEFLSAIVNA
tara:strand:+ start:8077 stop:8841 length:765 start_codon:yes stop_codon:yes gene_type:complete